MVTAELGRGFVLGIVVGNEGFQFTVESGGFQRDEWFVKDAVVLFGQQVAEKRPSSGEQFIPLMDEAGAGLCVRLPLARGGARVWPLWMRQDGPRASQC